MTETLIQPADTMLVLTAIIGIVAMGMFMEKHPVFGQIGVMFVILFSAFLSGVNVLPRSSPVYDVLNNEAVLLAIPLILFNANLKRIWRETGRTLLAFIIAAMATVVACVIGSTFVDLGPQEGTWVGLMTSAFIGGSVNLAAVAGAMEVVDHPIIGLMFAAIYVVLIPYFILLMAFPSFGRVWRWFSPRTEPIAVDLPEVEAQSESTESKPIDVAGLAFALAMAALCAVIGEKLADVTNFAAMKYLGLSALAIVIATFLPGTINRMSGYNELGHILIYAFLAVMGARIDFSTVSAESVSFIVFVIIVFTVHLLFVSLVGRLLKLTGPELLVASNAAILGPPTAAAMATARGWSGLVTPGILVGVFGWAIASFVGVTIAAIL